MTGSTTHSNSWGAEFIGSPYYVNRDIDNYLYNHLDLNVFFACGNSGSNGMMSISQEATAKNIIAIGSSESTFDSQNIDYVAYYSSQGPAYDKRIKPELVSPGDALESALSNGDGGPTCGTVTMSGTSMASPGAAGLAALAKEYFERSDLWESACNKKYKFCQSYKISGVLTKALLLHSGTKMTVLNDGDNNQILGDPPDNIQGWGRISLLNILSLKSLNDYDLFIDDLVQVSSQNKVVYNVQIQSTQQNMPLVVTISWYDAPG